MLEQAFSFIQLPWVTLLIGTGLAIYGIVVSIRATAKRRLVYAKVDVTILGVNHDSWLDQLEIKYKGVEVQRLTACRIGVWNGGNTTIYRSQLVDKDPFRVQIPDNEKLLVATLVDSSRDVTNVDIVQATDTTANITFDFLDPGDGFVIHTAQSCVQGSTQLRGTIKEITGGPSMWSSKVSSGKWSALSEILFGPLLAFSVIGLSTLIRKSVGIQDDTQAASIFSGVVIVLVLLAFVLASTLWKRVRLLKAKSVPKVVRSDPSIDTHIKYGLL